MQKDPIKSSINRTALITSNSCLQYYYYLLLLLLFSYLPRRSGTALQLRYFTSWYRACIIIIILICSPAFGPSIAITLLYQLVSCLSSCFKVVSILSHTNPIALYLRGSRYSQIIVKLLDDLVVVDSATLTNQYLEETY